VADHKHGSMSIRTQQKTFEGFVKVAVRSVIAIFVVLILLAIFNS
jgi:hypothetical protein